MDSLLKQEAFRDSGVHFILDAVNTVIECHRTLYWSCALPAK